MFNVLQYVEIFKQNINKNNVAFLCENNNDTAILLVNDTSVYDNSFNFPMIENMHTGDCIVMFPKDLVLTWKSEKSLLGKILRLIVDILYAHKINVYTEGNDIMFNGYKLFGTMKTEKDGIYYEGMFISFGTDINIIKSVCKKPMNKAPMALPISIRNELIMLIEEFCKENNLEICRS